MGADIYFTGPEEWYAEEFDIYMGKHVNIDDIEELDVLMLLRVQHERHDGSESFQKNITIVCMRLTEDRYKHD